MKFGKFLNFDGSVFYLDKDRSIWDMQQLDDLTSKLGTIHNLQSSRVRWNLNSQNEMLNAWKIKIELVWQFFHLVMRELTMKIALWQLQSIYQTMQNLGQN